jgi:hypothetical protein
MTNSPQTFIAVLDRFEEEQAVLLLESGGETVDELIMHRNELPESGRHQDAVFTVIVDEESVVEIQYKPTETDDRAEAAQQQFDRLARRPPSDDESSRVASLNCNSFCEQNGSCQYAIDSSDSIRARFSSRQPGNWC